MDRPTLVWAFQVLMVTSTFMLCTPPQGASSAPAPLSPEQAILKWRIKNSVIAAERIITTPRAERPSRLFLTVLSSRDAQTVCCCAKNLAEHVAPHNPFDLFVFSLNNMHGKEHYLSTCKNTSWPKGVSVYFLPVSEHWTNPNRFGSDRPEDWAAKDANEDYRKMGVS